MAFGIFSVSPRELMPFPNKKTIGLALSGASTRSIFYIGFLEVLQEQNFQVDYIAATSSASIPAAAYACGTLGDLKKLALKLNKQFLLSILGKSQKGGSFYSLDNVEQALKRYTHGLKFEEVRPLMAFVATDIDTGEEIVLSMGDIAKAICATCALPVMFEPVLWGNRRLVDGGLASVVPGEAARRAGSDIVIGIHLRTTAYVFGSWELRLKAAIDWLIDVFWVSNPVFRLWRALINWLSENDFFQYLLSPSFLRGKDYRPGMFTILGKAIDASAAAQKKYHPKNSNYHCDLLIVPKIPKIPLAKRLLYMHFTDFKDAAKLYRLGRQTAMEYLPKMRNLVLPESDRDNIHLSSSTIFDNV